MLRGGLTVRVRSSTLGTTFFLSFFSSLTAVPSENQCISSGAYEWPVLVALQHAVVVAASELPGYLGRRHARRAR